MRPKRPFDIFKFNNKKRAKSVRGSIEALDRWYSLLDDENYGNMAKCWVREIDSHLFTKINAEIREARESL